ncbi:MAG: TRAP transporter small permease subunit [Bacteroidota bacterium]
MKIVSLLKRILERTETALLVLFLSVMIVLAFAQVVMRNLFGTGFLWGDPLVRHMVLWSGFFGAALAASVERHISIDAVTKFLSERLKHLSSVVTNAFGGVVCFYLGLAAWGFMAEERINGGESFLGLPSWVGLTVIPVGYWLIMLHFGLNIVDHVAALVSHRTTEAKP